MGPPKSHAGDLEADAAALLLLAVTAQLMVVIGGVVVVSGGSHRGSRADTNDGVTHERNHATRNSRTFAASLKPIPVFLLMPRAAERSSAISTAV